MTADRLNILPISIVYLTHPHQRGIIILLNYIEMEFNMKKGLKVIVPLLLAIALVGCSIWYLFAYDRGFTQDVLLQTARFFDSRGGTTTAQWFYNMAYKLVRDNDAVAIELAEQYKNDGNYSKAEYTLHNAFQDKLLQKPYYVFCTHNPKDKIAHDIKKEIQSMYQRSQFFHF